MCHQIQKQLRNCTNRFGNAGAIWGPGPEDEIFTLSEKSRALSPWWRSILEPLADLPEPGALTEVTKEVPRLFVFADGYQ